MKVLAGLLCSNLALQAYATASSKAYGYIFDPNFQLHRDTLSISPTTARLLLAKRLGLSQYHSLDSPGEEEIKILNKFGGNEDQALFLEDQRTSLERLLIFVENVETPEDLIDSQFGSPPFEIVNPPSFSQNIQLATDLLVQDRERRILQGSSCVFAMSKNPEVRGGINRRSGDQKGCSPDTSISDVVMNNTTELLNKLISTESSNSESLVILHISSLEGLSSKSGVKYGTSASELRMFFQKLYSFHANRLRTTVILMPSRSESEGHTAASSYGTYNTQKSLRPRQSKPEQPLTAQPAAGSSQKISSPPSQVPHASALIKGVLPVCQTSKEDCIRHTKNCSGRGTAYLKHSKNANMKHDCWACKCESTTHTVGEGVKTTKWGGPACQKKDVSVPFFLLAGFTITMLMTVGWAIGLLFSIGQEDLPSVLGAGVAGPRAQK